jgi:prolyl-tRNA synthetase
MFIESNEEKYSEWWNKVIADSDMLDIRYKIKGFFVWKPLGFRLMKNLRLKWDKMFEKEGIQETYFPLLVPIEYAKQNASWWESFQEQAFYATGYFDKERKLFLRPTGEPAMYPMFSLWIRSHRDLPLRIYETVSSFRNETKSTKALARDVELGPWYEIHTCHETKREAEKEIELGIKMNEEIFDMLAVARLAVRKPRADCFPGSVGAVEFYTLMNDKLIENASCNNLGQAYAKAFNIKYVDENEKEQFVWQTCTGNGERFLGSIIANHSDEKGLVVPPELASTKASIVLFKVSKKDVKIETGLKNSEVEIVETNSIGDARYSAEKRGVPVRIEIGPKELKEKSCSVAYRTGKKKNVKLNDLKKELSIGLVEMQKELRDKTEKELKSRIKEVDNKEDANEASIALVGWCGEQKCSDWIQSDTGKEIIGMTLEQKKKKCIHCGKEGELTYFSKSY